MEPNKDVAIEVIQRALKHSGFSEKEIHEAAFHLTDWIADLESLVNFLENPSGYADEEVRRIIIAFLVHAPDHIKIAAEIILDGPENGRNV